MKKAYNFNAGPCVLPKPAIEAAIEALKDFKGTGMSVIEVSHRSKEWDAVLSGKSSSIFLKDTASSSWAAVHPSSSSMWP